MGWDTDIPLFRQAQGSVTHQLRANGYIERMRGGGDRAYDLPQQLHVKLHTKRLSTCKDPAYKAHRLHGGFAATDSMALGFMKATSELKIRIPKDLSLMGFDNIQYAELPRIDLTTIEQPQQAIAATAVDTLLERINNPQAGYAHHVSRS